MRIHAARKVSHVRCGLRAGLGATAVCLGLAVAACGSAGRQPAPGPEFAGLPAPSAVVKHGQYVNLQRTRTGDQFTYIGGGFEDRVEPDSTKLLFTPVWGTLDPPSILDSARAGFQFNSADYNGPPEIDLNWVTPPDYSNLWIGIANWGEDRWDWLQTTGPNLTLPSLEPYTSAEGVFIALVLLGTDVADLAWARLGPELWRVEVVDDPDGGDVGLYTSLKLDSADHPHIAYFDMGNTALKYAYHDGASWVVATVDDTADCGRYASLALDAGDNPVIAYQDSTNEDLKLATYNGMSWTFESINSAESTGFSCTLEFDSAQRPCIAQYNATLSRVEYVHYDGFNWQTEGVGPGTTVLSYISLALDSADLPHLTYPFGTNQVYAYSDGVTWHFEDISTGLSHISDGEHALGFDSLGNAHVLTYDLINGYPYYSTRAAGVWTEELVPADHNTGTSGSLAINSADEPIFTCYGGGMELFHNIGGTWQHVTVDNQGWTGHYTSIALDSQDSPCVSYRCPGDQSLRFVRYIPPT